MKTKKNKQVAAATENIQEVNNPKSSLKVKEAKKEKKSKKAKEVKTKEAIKEETVKEVANQQKVSIIEEVISKRGVKYIYPADVKDTLARKNWRQKTRNELHRLELAVSRIKDQNSKEYKKALKEFETYRAQVLKPEQVA